MIRRLIASLLMLFVVGSAGAAVDANTASVDTLQTVRGIGPSIAARIVAERARGPFRSLDDLQARVRGVGEASVRRMAARGLTVSAGGGGGRDPQSDTKRVEQRVEQRVGSRDAAASKGGPGAASAVPAHERSSPRPRRDARPSSEARS